MKIIFLDIDGVLNTPRYVIEFFEKNGTKMGGNYQFDPICMEYLKEIIEKSNAKIVVSSTWRIHKEAQPTCRLWNTLLNNLKKYGINIELIIDITPTLHLERGDEIRKWLEDNKHLNIEEFVILDDDSDMCEFNETNLAKCDWMNGITENTKNKALEILNVRNIENEQADKCARLYETV